MELGIRQQTVNTPRHNGTYIHFVTISETVQGVVVVLSPVTFLREIQMSKTFTNVKEREDTQQGTKWCIEFVTVKWQILCQFPVEECFRHWYFITINWNTEFQKRFYCFMIWACSCAGNVFLVFSRNMYVMSTPLRQFRHFSIHIIKCKILSAFRGVIINPEYLMICKHDLKTISENNTRLERITAQE